MHKKFDFSISLAALKDLGLIFFPVHFVVEKGPQGSRTSIIEQD